MPKDPQNSLNCQSIALSNWGSASKFKVPRRLSTPLLKTHSSYQFWRYLLPLPTVALLPSPIASRRSNQFCAERDSEYSNVMTFLFIAGLVLSVVAGALVKCTVERAVSKSNHPKCGKGQCGEDGWTVLRRDSET